MRNVPQKHARVGSAIALAILSLGISACLVPPSDPATSVNAGIDVPDPAMVQIYTAAAIYGTQSFWGHIPHYAVDLTKANYAPSAVTDALPTLPSGVSATWAPTVRIIGSQMVMYYSENFNGAHANCIGLATAPIYSNFTASSSQWCDGPYGMLDPQIFTDTTDGTGNYLLWSEQWGCNSNGTGTGCNSQLMMQPLTSNGLGFNGGSYLLLSHAAAEMIQGNTTTPNIGVVENPAMVNDPDNNYDLTFSLGQWNDKPPHTDYVTGETACTQIINAPDCGTWASDGSQLIPDGGASMDSDGSPASNWMIFAHWDGNVRDDEIGTTGIINCNNLNC
jgi:hypothetical protein